MMGWPMAGCLVRAGHQVAIHDADPQRMRDFVSEVGGEAIASLSELGRSCEVAITMLPNSDIVSTVLFGESGLEEGLEAGKIVIDMTSGVPAKTASFAARLAQHEVGMIDAPVSGGASRAKRGDLAIMVGGDSDLIETCRPVLQAMGRIMPTGAVGSGQAMKALNNMVSAAGFLIGVEALLIGKKFGLDGGTMVDILNASTGMNNSTQKKFKQFVLSGRYDSGFALDLMVKDLTIAMEVGRDCGVPTPLSALCRELWASAQALLGPGADHTASAKLSEQLAGISLADPPGRNE